MVTRTRYDYVAVGHVTCDVLGGEHGGAEVRRPGGTAFYSALQAARLGLSALIVTQGVPSQIEQLLAPYRDELRLHVIAAPQTTTLATHGGADRDLRGARRQKVLSWAGAIETAPAVAAQIMHLAPVARETPSRWTGPASFVGVTPQGLVRDWGSGEIETVELDGALLPERFDAAVLSELESPFCGALFEAASRRGACIAVTAGARPATLHLGAGDKRRALQSPQPHAVQVRDDVGAGDVFAAAFFVALADGRDPLAAAAFANAAAAVRIGGVGPSAIGTRAQIEALLV